MFRGYPFGYSETLVGLRPNPGPAAPAAGRTRRSAWLYRSRRSLFPAHPRGKKNEFMTSRHRYICPISLVSNLKCAGVNDIDFPSQLPCVTYRCGGPAPQFPIVNSQQQGCVIYQKPVTFQHTTFVIEPIGVDYGIRLLQDRAVDLPCR